MPKKDIAVIVGSIRKQSLNRQLAKAIIELSPPQLSFDFVEIRHLPHYNQDFDDENVPPQEWVSFREHIRKVDGIMFVTPEYNRSVSPFNVVFMIVVLLNVLCTGHLFAIAINVCCWDVLSSPCKSITRSILSILAVLSSQFLQSVAYTLW